MAWIKSDQSLRQHPKLTRLMVILQIEKPQAIGHMHLLWYWVLDYAKGGDTSKFSSQEIAIGAEWKGDSELFVRALRESRFMDENGYIHDWMDYSGKLEVVKRDNAARQAEFRQRKEREEKEALEKIAKKTPSESAPIDKYHLHARSALHILNEASGRKFREVDENLSVISARLREKDVTIDGVRLMIERQAKMWKETTMSEYLRPQTLFGKEKFDNYYAAKDQPIRTQQNGNPVAARRQPTFQA